MRIWSRPRRWAALGLGLAAVVGLAWAAPGRDPWPPRLVIRAPVPGIAWGYSPDGRGFRTTSAAGLTWWDATTGERGATTPPPPIWRKQISGDGRRFVGWVGDDFGAAEIVEGDAVTEAIERRFPVQGVQANDLRFRDADRTIQAVLGNRQQAMAVATWDLGTGVETRRAIVGPGPNHIRQVAYSPDGRTWAYLDKTRDAIQLWDGTADRPLGPTLRTPTTRRDLAAWPWVGAVFTPDGRTLIVGHGDHQAEAWDVATGRFRRLIPLHRGGVVPMHFCTSPGGTLLASNGSTLGSRSWLAGAWNDLSQRLTGQDASDWSNEAVVADLASGKVLARATRCQAVAISPDGRTVVTRALDGTTAFRPVPEATIPAAPPGSRTRP